MTLTPALPTWTRAARLAHFAAHLPRREQAACLAVALAPLTDPGHLPRLARQLDTRNTDR